MLTEKDSDSDDIYSKDDIITIELDTDTIKVSYPQLCKFSKVIQSKRGINEAREFLNQSITKYESEYNIEERNIVLFFQIIQEEKKVPIKTSDFWDLNVLSNLFRVQRLIKALKKFAQLHSSDVSFVSSLILRQSSTNFSFFFDAIDDSSFEIGLEDILKKNIQGCLQCREFSSLPFVIVARIIEARESDFECDSLYDFISDRVDERFSLFRFLDLKSLSSDRFNDLYHFYINGKVPKNYFDYLTVDLEYIKSLRDKQRGDVNNVYEQINENRKLKKENGELRERKDLLQARFDSLKSQNTKAKNEKIILEKNNEAHVRTLLGENKRMKEENDMLVNEVKKLEDKINKIMDEIERKKRDMSYLNKINFRRTAICRDLIMLLSDEVTDLGNLNSSGIFIFYFLIRHCYIWLAKWEI